MLPAACRQVSQVVTGWYNPEGLNFTLSLLSLPKGLSLKGEGKQGKR